MNYAVRGFAGYGKLSGKTLDDLRAGERVAVGSAKRDPLDFVLWKSAKADEPDDTKWDSPYGLGRPGWHIECSADEPVPAGRAPSTSTAAVRTCKFPHHENEIAQTEGAFGGTLANFWMHYGPLAWSIRTKMSKSLGNFRTIRQTVAQGDPGRGRRHLPREPARSRSGALLHPCAPTTAARRTTRPTTWSTRKTRWTACTRHCRTCLPPTKASTGTSRRPRPSRRPWTTTSTARGAIAAAVRTGVRSQPQQSARSAGQLKALASLLGLLTGPGHVFPVAHPLFRRAGHRAGPARRAGRRRHPVA